MRHGAAFVLLASLQGLVACTTVGPDYQVPATAKQNLPAAKAPFAEQGTGVSLDPVPVRWWHLYEDPVLDALIDEALQANTDLRVATARLEQASAGLAEAEAANEPVLGASAKVDRGESSGESFLQRKPRPVSTVGDIGLRVSYEIDLFGKLRRATEAARGDSEAAAAGLDLMRTSVVAEVVRSYVAACTAGHELERAQSTVELQSQGLALTTRLAAAGRGSELEVTRSRGQLEQNRAAMPPLVARRRAALYRLATLLGKPPQESPASLAECHQPPRLAQRIPVGDGAALLRRRPDVRQAERTLAGAVARIGVATAALYPTVSIGLGAGSTGLLADLGEPAANHWKLGSLITWTLPTGGERARVRAASAAADAALARFDGVVLGALREVETLLSSYQRNLERNARLRAARDDARLAEAQEQRLYSMGKTPFLNALDAQRTLAAAESALAASDSQVADDQVSLFLALGGGWESPAPDAASPVK